MARDRPSFTDDLKAELASLQPARLCCQHAELHALVDALAGRPGQSTVTLRVPRNALARKIVQLVKATGGHVDELHKGATPRRPTYVLRVSLSSHAGSADGCCARAGLRGAFLAKGTIGDPGSGYHLEIAVTPAALDGLRRYLERLHLPSRALTRRGRAVWYLKGADPIRRTLGLMGANRAVMRFEHDRIVRDMRSQANRRVNSETANLQKRLRSAHDQVKRIRELQRADPRLIALPPAVRQAAELRLKHPQAGLSDLAASARVSKSAIAGRIRRLMREPLRAGPTRGPRPATAARLSSFQ